MARESKAQTYPAPVHHYLRHRRAAVPWNGHLPIAARVKKLLVPGLRSIRCRRSAHAAPGNVIRPPVFIPGGTAVPSRRAAKSRQRLLDPGGPFDNHCQQQRCGQDHRSGQLYREPIWMTHLRSPEVGDHVSFQDIATPRSDRRPCCRAAPSQRAAPTNEKPSQSLRCRSP